MKAVLSVAVLGTVLLALPAQAEFQIAPIAPGAGTTMPAGAKPIVLFSDEGMPSAAVPVRRRSVVIPPVPIAQGFGRRIPLGFATRQIVPAKVKVTFGPGVEQDALVDWSGGRPWVDALRAAVRPLGLRVTATSKVVLIARA